jgi:single-stranded DNA-specific DHH superfamily exonuclease
VGKSYVRTKLTKLNQIKSFLDAHYYTPTPPSEILDPELAAERLAKAIQNEETICTWGDFDVDV